MDFSVRKWTVDRALRVTLQRNAGKNAKFLAILDEEGTRVRMRTAHHGCPLPAKGQRDASEGLHGDELFHSRYDYPA